MTLLDIGFDAEEKISNECVIQTWTQTQSRILEGGGRLQPALHTPFMHLDTYQNLVLKRYRVLSGVYNIHFGCGVRSDNSVSGRARQLPLI